MTSDPAGAAPARFGEARAAAESALRLVRPLSERGGARAGASALELGEALRVVYVRRDALAEYEPGTDPRPVLFEAEERFYPVFGGGEVAAAIRVVRRDGGWVMKSVGEANLARDLIRVHAAEAVADPRPEYFIVHVPSLYRIFIGHFDTAGALVLAPVYDDEPRGFVRGQAQPGADLLARLVPDARKGQDAVTAGPGPQGS